MTEQPKGRTRRLGRAALLACALLALVGGTALIVSPMGPQITPKFTDRAAREALHTIEDMFRPPHTHCGLETNAVGSMRTYCSAQTMFKRADWETIGTLQHPTGLEAGKDTLEYCCDLRDLNQCLDGNGDPINLISSAFANARGYSGKPKHGYYFMEMETIGGKFIDWKTKYAMCAVPAVYGRTGYRTFIVCTNGTVFAKDTGEGVFIDDYPADPAAAGWIIAE